MMIGGVWAAAVKGQAVVQGDVAGTEFDGHLIGGVEVDGDLLTPAQQVVLAICVVLDDCAKVMAGTHELHRPVLNGDVTECQPGGDFAIGVLETPVVEVLVHRQHLVALRRLDDEFDAPHEQVRAEQRFDGIEDRWVGREASGFGRHSVEARAGVVVGRPGQRDGRFVHQLEEVLAGGQSVGAGDHCDGEVEAVIPEGVGLLGAQRSGHGDTLLNMGPVVDKEDVRRLAPPWDRC